MSLYIRLDFRAEYTGTVRCENVPNVPAKIRIQIPIWSHKGEENTIIKYVSVGNPFSLESKTLKRRKVLFF